MALNQHGGHMNIDKLSKIRMKDLKPLQQEAVKLYCPKLADFVLHHDNGNFVDIDFYLKDDPLLNKPGYTGSSISEFIYGSPTYNQLSNIIDYLEKTL